ncbi:2TM domain-containing protein [Spongiimicrobium sp. 3-5]|uniref:2TM domain-containing protein n=1 Tax=Spongiimicrobium sp. 3-5 TaxID=3332596 RepID=UPI003980F0A4
MENQNTDNKYLRAKERVDKLKKFYANLWSYIIVISLLAFINYFTNNFRYMWFLWAALGWGIGVFFHAMDTFNLNPFFGKNWEEKKIKEYMQEDGKENKWN